MEDRGDRYGGLPRPRDDRLKRLRERIEAMLDRFRGTDPETGETDYWGRGGLAGLLGMPAWYEQSPVDIAMGFAGSTTPAVTRVFHGSPAGRIEKFSKGKSKHGGTAFVSEDEAVAKRFARGEGGAVQPFEMKAGTNLFDPRLPDEMAPLDAALNANFSQWFPGALFNARTASDWARRGDWGIYERPEVMSWLRAKGYDGVRLSEDALGNFNSIGLFAPNRSLSVAPEAKPSGIRAYHGSPHDFDRFDLSKIGTGEGAQAYGHGLYFSDDIIEILRKYGIGGLAFMGAAGAGAGDADPY